MTSAGNTDRAWEDDIVHSLKALTAEEVPSLEIMLFDAVANWMFSPQNPGDGYGDEHAGHMISTLFSALDSARSFQPEQQPAATDDIRVARARIVDGAHELAANGWIGVSTTVSRLMPSMLTELQSYAGEPAKQTYRVFLYLLYAVAVGTREEHDPAVITGLTEVFTAWDGVLRGGFVLPWRRPPA